MENKKIYVDGVDVSKCRYFLKDTEGQDYNTDEFVKGCCEAKGSCIGYEFAGYGLCRGDKDCYFKQLARKTQECERLKEELKFLENNDDLLISNLQILWGKQIANEQGDCKNIDYLLPRTKEIYHKITEIERTLKDVAFAQSVKLGKTKPLGDTGSPRSYKRWEKRERQLLEREFLK